MGCKVEEQLPNNPRIYTLYDCQVRDKVLVPEPNEFVLTLSSCIATNAIRQHPGKNSRIPRKHYLRHAETPRHLGLKIHNSYIMPIQYLLRERAAYDTSETHLKKRK
jgi:hypothetical protein